MSDMLTHVQNTYDEIGVNFSRTRSRNWPEILPYLTRLKQGDTVLDIGCGNGRLLQDLPEGICYAGVDFSKTLIEEAKKLHPGFSFTVGDITQGSTWEKLGKYNAIYCVAVLHHLPERQQQVAVLSHARKHLAEGGFVYVSTWNLLQPRFLADHLRSFPLKLRNIRWLNVPFQRKWHRFCTTLTAGYLKSILIEAGLDVQEIRYVDEAGKQTNCWKGRNQVAIATKT